MSAKVPSGSWLLHPPSPAWFPDGNHLGAILPLVPLDQAEYLMSERDACILFHVDLKSNIKKFYYIF